jgi:hypothetical protein
MLKTLQIAIQVIWAVSVITLGTGIGAIYGWEHHGWMGAVAIGFVGFVVSVFVAAAPMAFLKLLLG